MRRRREFFVPENKRPPAEAEGLFAGELLLAEELEEGLGNGGDASGIFVAGLDLLGEQDRRVQGVLAEAVVDDRLLGALRGPDVDGEVVRVGAGV